MHVSSAREKGEQETSKKDKIKPDTALKNFWRNNERFADLFNAVLFDGKEVIQPEELMEADTDLSSVIKMNRHADTVQRVFDVVKKTSNGVSFVVWGLENQEKIHYAMPLRHMLGDALSYLKEYQDLAAKNKQENNFETEDEFLSKMKKTDRLHPVVSICIYYGEKEWDGPFRLTDMLDIPEELKDIVSDYDMHLVQLLKSEGFRFHNEDINTVFEICRAIYKKEHDKIRQIYETRAIDTELAFTIGAITKTQRLINEALQTEMGGTVDMCKAMEEWEQECVEKGKKQMLKDIIQKKLSMGKNISVIASDLEMEVSEIEQFIDNLVVQ